MFLTLPRRLRASTGRWLPSAARCGFRAFTLIELLVCVTVMSVGMVFVLGSLSRCMFSADVASKMTTASRLLSEKMWEFEAQAWLDNGTEEGSWEGDFGEPDEEFRWTRTVGQVQRDFGENASVVVDEALYEAALDVRWGRGKRERTLTAVTYVKKYSEEL